MLSKKQRFSRDAFPKKRPERRLHFSWGVVSLYKSFLPRASVVVSKKVLRKAHERNRLKRRIYEAVQKAAPPYSLVVYPRAEARTVAFTTLVEDLKSART